VLLAIALGTLPAAGPQSASGWTTYRDPAGRFTFQFPASFGDPSPGTNSGFADRVAAVRFSHLMGLGGEAALVKGPVAVDIQALGGLYDAIALEIVPEAALPAIRAARPEVTRDNFCDLLGAADHIRSGASLPASLLGAARRLDRMRNIDPRVVRCGVAGDVVTFHKEATFEAGTTSARQHIFGAIRFLSGAFSAFQMIRGDVSAPTATDLDALTRVVQSFSTSSR
jgi:hypothetical protein